MRGDWIDLEAKVEVTDEMDRNPLKMRAEAGFDKKVDAEKSAGAAVEVSAGAAVEVRAAGAVKVSRRAKETRDDEKIDILTRIRICFSTLEIQRGYFKVRLFYFKMVYL